MELSTDADNVVRIMKEGPHMEHLFF